MGGFTPLDGFMNEDAYLSVVDKMRWVGGCWGLACRPVACWRGGGLSLLRGGPSSVGYCCCCAAEGGALLQGAAWPQWRTSDRCLKLGHSEGLPLGR